MATEFVCGEQYAHLPSTKSCSQSYEATSFRASFYLCLKLGHKDSVIAVIISLYSTFFS